MPSSQESARSPAEIKAEVRALGKLEVRFADHVEGATKFGKWVLGEGPALSKTLGDVIEVTGRMHGDKPSKGK